MHYYFARGWFLVLLVAGGVWAETPERAIWRRPSAIVCREPWLYTANRDSGTISVVDTRNGKVAAEFDCGTSLLDLCVVPPGEGQRSRLLTVDPQAHQLVLLAADGAEIEELQRIDTPSYPQRVVTDAKGTCCAVSGLWSRQVAIYRLSSNPPALHPSGRIDLPFATRAIWIAADGSRLIAADAFSAQLACIDVTRQRLVAIKTLDGHNLGGLAANASRQALLISHQLLNSQVSTTRERVFWGSLLGNVLREVEWTELFPEPAAATEPPAQSPQPEKIGHWSLLPLGEPSHGTGDPSVIVVSPSGRTMVCLSGVDELAVRPSPQEPMMRYEVGRRPVDVAISSDERRAYVANQLSDTISVVDFRELRVVGEWNLGPRPPRTAAQRGEALFYDARLSLDGWYSCHSCHIDGHTNGLTNDNLGDDSFGAPKRVPSLLGVSDTGPWAWSGKRSTLTEQIHKSIESTMRGESRQTSPADMDDLRAYLETLSPPPSLVAARGQWTDQALQATRRGRAVFMAAGCEDCHAQPHFTSEDSYDVGLRDELGNTHFNPPSLQGISQRRRYLHDGRAATLDEALNLHTAEAVETLSQPQRADLLAYLNSL